MKRNDFNEYISNADFRKMFNEMGWDKTNSGYDEDLLFDDDHKYHFESIAERNGFNVYVCHTNESMTRAVCRRIDMKLKRKSNDYIAIFIYPEGLHHLWMVPIKNVDKREPVYVEYTTLDQADFLFSKMGEISFPMDDTKITIVDVRSRVQKAFEVNSAKITKDFYSGFKKEHDAFAKFIEGINDINDRKWYTSVMLNRLMFCYFIQKKGFLNGERDYLRNRFNWVKDQRGKNKFYSTFYKGFLCRLFHGGLNSPKHSDDFEDIYGRIPYLNGGMFDEHQLEKQNADLDIADEAFDNLFNFFDKWQWHLDTSITASGKDINPDVLGYIFEQYINDRAQMGAYYTKEDITEYIGKNCIIPYLVDEVSKTSSAKDFKSDGYVWTYLKNSGDKYIYDAVKKGYTEDYAQKLPENISIGLDTTQPNLLERRSNWNDKTPDDFALPTEIWRETIERLKHCDEVLHKIKAGEITHINDFITYNLDIRQFVYDLIEGTHDHLFVRHFYAALRKITILDPTCGSGAFLFAAMNILEPLYQVCIERMEEFHEKNDNLFKDELGEIENKYRSNIQYFIYKSIILHNLYGVDIMVEATEIAKLRLFLKMVAVVEVDKHADNLGLDPLPDIDFNIRCGNTLVGYATEEELNNSLTFGDMFARQEFETKVHDEMNKVALANKRFKEVQFNSNEDISTFKAAKADLNNRLSKLNELLNNHLYSNLYSKEPDFDYARWYNETKPFHWLAEFYQIIHDNGGFDVVIGNPPYVVYTTKSSIYIISDSYITKQCANLYSYCIERSQEILSRFGRFGMIVPNSCISANKMIPVQNIIIKEKYCWISNYSWRPSKLFEGADMLLTIIINCPSKLKNIKRTYSTIYNKWYNEFRSVLFKNIFYTDVTNILIQGSIPKIQSINVIKLIDKMKKKSEYRFLSDNLLQSTTKYYLFYFRAVQYWFKILDKEPVFIEDGVQKVTGEMKTLYFNSERQKNVMIAFLSSSCFFLNYIIWSSCQVVNIRDFNIYFNFDIATDDMTEKLDQLGRKLEADYQKNSCIKKRNYTKKGHNFTMQKQHFFIKYSKTIIDEIDEILAKYYGFTEEELDYIINYDIKYRMGDELNEE